MPNTRRTIKLGFRGSVKPNWQVKINNYVQKGVLLAWFQSVNFFGGGSSRREFLRFDFSPHLIILVTANLEYPPGIYHVLSMG